ncbi:peptidase S8 and S53 subtilisin kexin sedolisin [Paenibacillus curdlanolyticus YK9]|uniref:Peptidase S8 and S53 subtilisin kexin sedolisin n=1 Tax=Paenibacillus curdlanolyticus YK9 TaxID=717606 RepID=E0IEH6_9BACL|nr:S8 family serine peptidase [Paenibacillus curdlanolyticus]EFM09064.1 peptidase S8 and S53 subtilisin kexin sedolisin [Paenibacillus curdlanolyticus YK9]
MGQGIDGDNRGYGQKKPRFRAILFGLLAVSLLVGLFSAAAPEASQSAAAAVAADEAANAKGSKSDEASLPATSWLLRWKDASSAKRLPDTVLIQRQVEPPVDVIAPADANAVDVAKWLEMLRGNEDVSYVVPNAAVHALGATAAPGQANDPNLAKQRYLDLIGAKQAWATVHDQTSMTIALVDTGVDLDHPDLKGNLVEGVNLVRPGTPPEDDNGHGTSVAGVLSAVGNNGVGVTGLLWRAKIMPIKALDENGSGDESKLGEAILYAVRKGARIVVLSVGLYRYSPYMRDIAQYAEGKGVLLVAASGNDGEQLGNKAAVKYPAAYPTVLAVGGVMPSGKPEPRSSAGPEVDLAAPWDVFTTAVGGGYKYEEGTSMASPQVAAAAALVLAMHPSYKPYQVRELLRQTAKDIGADGVDEQSGYGLLQVNRAVTGSLKVDAYEPNDSRDRAARFPVPTRLSAQLTGGKDKDWYVIDAPYDGTLSIQLQGLNGPNTTMPPVRLTMYAGDRAASSQDAKLGNTTVEWKVKKGRNYIELQLYDRTRTDKLPYLLTSDFRIYSDPYESNDKSYEASVLQARSQVIAGTFDKQGDRDWFVVDFQRSGTLRLQLSTDTVRIDPSLAVQRAGQQLVSYDDNGDGEQEQSPLITVTPGKYYIRVFNAAASDASPVVGTYSLRMEVVSKYDDPNEPNDKSYASTVMRSGTEYVGVIDKSSDEDWFQLRLDRQSYASLALSGIPSGRTMTVTVYDKRQAKVKTIKSVAGHAQLSAGLLLNQGQYTFKLTSDAPFDSQYYRFKVKTAPLVAGYRDIDGHWAETAIASLTKEGILSGYSDYRFAPDRAITRAEGAALLVRAFASKAEPAKIDFRDVPSRHWAFGAVAAAVGAGYMNGYPDNRFGPDQLLTRAEMAVMLGQAAGVRPVRTQQPPFRDVAADNWAAPMLTAMLAKHMIGGYADNRFMPGQSASRAEFAAMLYRIRH